MNAVAERTASSFILTRNTEIRGVIARHLIVPAGLRFDLYGVMVGDLTVEPGGAATIHGSLNGTVANWGGDVQVFGFADAIRDLDPANPTRVAAGARIGS